MLEFLAKALRIAVRFDLQKDQEKVARQQRWEDEYFWQGRKGTPGEWPGR